MGIAERSGAQASPLGTLHNLNRHAEFDETGLSTVALRLPGYRVASGLFSEIGKGKASDL